MARLRFIVSILALVTVASAMLNTPSASALTGWNAGRIINDSVFTASSSMSASQIQSFLNGKVTSCDTNGLKLSEYGGPDLNGDGKVQRWEWGKANYSQTKFVCLKDYVADGKKASQIIYEKAQKYRISPKVLLVLLQKEQSLVTDTWPLNVQYRTATGYGCPDTAPCDSQYYGLVNQLDWAAKMFRAIMDDSPGWYTPYNLGNNYIQYNPNSSCGGSTVNVENRATQALYNYTPYQPNKAALDAGWGSASCGAYGNRNFFMYFSSWFGSPNANASYGFTVVSRELYSDSTYTTKVGNETASIEPSSSLYAKIVVKNTGNQTWYNDLLKLGTANPQDRVSKFQDSSWPSGNRPAVMQEASVAANGLATFKFKLSSPSSLGSYKEDFGVLIEGQRWLSGLIPMTLTVASQDPIYTAVVSNVRAYRDASHSVQQPALTTYPGSKIFFTGTLKNTGNRDLPADLTRIATTNARNRISAFNDQTWPATNRPVKLGSVLAPGASTSFAFSMTIPEGQASNVYAEQFGLVIEGQRWVSDNVMNISLNVKERPPTTLSQGATLLRGESLLSANEQFSLILQGDGNLVLYSVNTGKPLWNSRTHRTTANRLVLQGDGNLVLYSSTGKPLWYTKTNGKDGDRLSLQTDANLVLYSSTNKPLWHTRTNGAE